MQSPFFRDGEDLYTLVVSTPLGALEKRPTGENHRVSPFEYR